MFRAIQFVHCTVYRLQCTVLQYTILKGTKIKGVNMWSVCFFLSLGIIWNRLNQFWVVVFNQWHVFSICIWLLPLVFTSMDDMCIRVQNVFRVLLKSLSEICKLCFTMWNGIRYWQQTAQLAKWVQATENFVQPMAFSVLAIGKTVIAYKSAVSDQVRMMIKNILMSLIKFIVHHTKDEASGLLQKITGRAE